MRRLNYTDEDVIRVSNKVYSMAGLLKGLGLQPIGGNYATMKRRLKIIGLTCDHWTGQGWNKGEQLKKWEDYSRTASLKKHLINEMGHECQSCHNTEWMGLKITLEIDHIDGDRTNNNRDNLRLLCCNCHALTPTWRYRKRKD